MVTPKFPPFPNYMFPCTTIIKTMGDVKDGAANRKAVIAEVVAMGNVQDATVDQTTTFMTRGANVDSVVYYPEEQGVNPDDLIEWSDEGFVYTVVVQRQEAGFGLMWAVYCKRVR